MLLTKQVIVIEGIPNQSSLNTCPAQIKVIKMVGKRNIITVLYFQKNKGSPKSLWNKYFFAKIKDVIRKSCRFTILAMLKPQLYPTSLPILEVYRLHQKIREKRENMVLRGFADAATVIVILINHFSLPSYLDLILKVISFYPNTNKEADSVLQ